MNTTTRTTIARFIALPGTPEQVEVIVRQGEDSGWELFINGGILSNGAEAEMFEDLGVALQAAAGEVQIAISEA